MSIEQHGEILLYPLQLHRQIARQTQHEMVVDMAQSKFLELAGEGQQLMPSFLAYCPFGMRDVPGPALGFTTVDWKDEHEKSTIIGAMKMIFRDVNATRYSFWSEAWFVSTTDEKELPELMKRPPRTREDREEMLFVMTVERGYEQPLITAWRVERPWDGSLPVLHLFDDMTDRLGLFSGEALDLLR